MRKLTRTGLVFCAWASCLVGQTAPQPHTGWKLVTGGENLIPAGYWQTVWESGNAFDTGYTSIAVKDGALVAKSGSNYVGGPSILAPRLSTRGDFGVIATLQAGQGFGGVIAITGSLPADIPRWKGQTQIEFGVDGDGNFVAFYWDGTQSSPNVFRTLQAAPAGGLQSSTLTVEMLRQGGNFQFYFNGALLGSIPDPGLFSTGYAFPGFLVYPNQQLKITQFALEVPSGDTAAKLTNPVGAIPFVHPGDSLRSLAAATGRIFGVQVSAEQLALGRFQASDPGAIPDPAFAPKAIGEFGGIVSASMYYFFTEAAQGAFTFDIGDALMADARANHLPVHCHQLIGPNLYTPAWVIDGRFTKAQLTQILQNHVQSVVSHFKGQCDSWDVVNEALGDDGSVSTKDNVWAQVIGPEYIDLAFQQARQSDPAAKLYYNEYQNENNTPKATAVFNLVSSMKQRGIPIDGVGMQCHWIPGNSFWLPNHDQMTANMTRLGQLGLSVRISELDARLALPASAAALADQANIFSTTVQACLDSPNCVSINMWGSSDRTSWIDSFYPGFGAATLFDASFREKPGYTNVMSTLRAAALLSKTAPKLPAAGVVNAANYSGAAVAAGEVVTLFPANSGPAALAGAQVDPSGKIATEIGKTRVLFDGVAAPMIYSVANQAAAVVPYEIAGRSSTLVQIEYNGVQSVAVTVPVAGAVPGIFTLDQKGSGQAAAFNQDSSPNSAANPAERGSIVVMFATGEGQTNPGGVTGLPAGSPAPAPVLPVTVSVGGANAVIAYAAAAPGFIGLMQLNFFVPAGIGIGDAVPLILRVGSFASNTVTIGVK